MFGKRSCQHVVVKLDLPLADTQATLASLMLLSSSLSFLLSFYLKFMLHAHI